MRCLIITCFLLCAPFRSAAAVETDSEIPFTLEKGHIVVSASIKGNTTVEMAVATGLEHSLFNAALLKEYKFPIYYTSEGIVTGSSLDRTITFVTVFDVRVGEVKVSSLNMQLGDQPTALISRRLGREIFGILGIDFFKGRIVQFDFAKRILRFLNVRPTTSQDPKGFATLRMRPSVDRNRLPITEDITLNGKKIKTLFDISALTVVSLTPSTSKEVGLAPPAEKSPPRQDKVSFLRFGEIEFIDVPVTLHAKASDVDHDSKGYGAVVGVALLQNFVVTFDFRGGVILLERL
jgi:Aspartyl protease